MEREKQIEEMAKIINKPCFEIMNEAGATDRDCPFPYTCEECAATNLYNAGYRKASEVAAEIFAEIEKEIELALDSNYKVKRDAQDMNDTLVIYAEGKIDCLRGLLGFIAELKKKYIKDVK